MSYHVYAEDGFEGAFRSLTNAKKAAKRGSKNRRMRYEVVETSAYGRTGGEHGRTVCSYRNGKES